MSTQSHNTSLLDLEPLSSAISYTESIISKSSNENDNLTSVLDQAKSNYDKFSKIDRQPLAAVWATRALAKIIGINVGVGRTNALNKLGEFGIAIFEEIFENPPSWEHYDRLFIESDFKGDAWD